MFECPPTLSETVKKWWSNAAQCCCILALLCNFHLQITRLNYTYFWTHSNQCIKLIMHQRHTYILGAAAACSDSFAEFLHSTFFFFFHRQLRLPLIRTHCHLKATAGIIGAILHICNDPSEINVYILCANADANIAASPSISSTSL